MENNGKDAASVAESLPKIDPGKIVISDIERARKITADGDSVQQLRLRF